MAADWQKSPQFLYFRSVIFSYDSPLKRCLKDMFLLSLITCVFPSLTISSAPSPQFGLGRFGFAAFAVSVALPLIQNNIDFNRGRHV